MPPTENLAHELGLGRDWELSWQTFSLWNWTEPTEPRQSEPLTPLPSCLNESLKYAGGFSSLGSQMICRAAFISSEWPWNHCPLMGRGESLKTESKDYMTLENGWTFEETIWEMLLSCLELQGETMINENISQLRWSSQGSSLAQRTWQNLTVI